MSYSFKALAAATVIALVQCEMASASSALVTQHVTVRYDDLNLEQKADARTMVRRLASASAKACGGKSLGLSGYAKVRIPFYTCRAKTLYAAVVKLDKPMITSEYAQRWSHESFARFAATE